MWKRLADLARLLFTFGEGLQQNRADIKELQREVRDLTAAVQQLSYEVRRVAENDSHERDKLALRNAKRTVEVRAAPSRDPTQRDYKPNAARIDGIVYPA